LPLVIAVWNRGVVARIQDDTGNRLRVAREYASRVELIGDDTPEGFSLLLTCHPEESRPFLFSQVRGKKQKIELTGAPAIRAAARILPAVNDWGGNETNVRDAVTLIEDTRSVERLFHQVANDPDKPQKFFGGDSARLKKLDPNIRLALEMATHEEDERRALEGELAILEAAWREAEEVASIADRLLIPERVEKLIRKWKREGQPDRGPAVR
jgi:hypothetical protein